MWLIVARSPWLFDAENGGKLITEKEERECILAASRYVEAHWKQAIHKYDWEEA